jgi:methylphosphotriester-DNA--protein-cysteine methyltransferase
MKKQSTYRWYAYLVFALLLVLSLQGAATATSNATYHGNIKSKIFHIVSCRYYDCKQCVKSFESRAAAIKAGYRACKVCKP